MNLWMGPLGDQLATRPMQTDWQLTMEPYQSGQLVFIHDQDHQCGDDSVWTRTWTQSDGLETLLRQLLGRTEVWCSLPHLQQVMYHRHPEQYQFPRILVHFRVVFFVHFIPVWVSSCLNPIDGFSRLHYKNFSGKCLPDCFQLPPADNILAKGETFLQSSSMSHDGVYITYHIVENGVLQVHFILTTPPFGYVWYPTCTATLH